MMSLLADNLINDNTKHEQVSETEIESHKE